MLEAMQPRQGPDRILRHQGYHVPTEAFCYSRPQGSQDSAA